MEKLLSKVIEGNHYVFKIIRVDDKHWTMNIIDKETGNIIDSSNSDLKSYLVNEMKRINRDNSNIPGKDFSGSKFDLGDEVIYVNDVGDVYKAEIFGIYREDGNRYALVLYDKDCVVGYTIGTEENINKFVDTDELEEGDIVTIKDVDDKIDEDFVILDKDVDTFNDKSKVIYFVKSKSGFITTYTEDTIESIKINGKYFVIDNL